MEKSLLELLDKAQKFECDSRKISEEDVFFALKGENVDGHNFIDEALQKGASDIIISDEKKKRERCIVVDDVYKTLQQLAKIKRSRLQVPLIAITGSAGKTTTKDLIVKVLSKKYKIGFNEHNYNSNISIPLQLLNLKGEYDLLVFEISAIKPGGIRYKCELLHPSFGLITNIGHMHLESFGSMENIFKTKTELYHYLQENSGLAFVDFHNKKLLNFINELSLKKVVYNNFDSKNNVFFEHEDPFLVYKCNGKSYKTNLFGKYNIENIVAAQAVGRYFGITDERIHDAIKEYIPHNSRSQKISTKEGNTIILDAYNANLDAILSGLETFQGIKAENKIIILGSMKETGEKTEEFHLAIGKKLEECSFEEVILVGEEMNYAKKIFNKAICFYNLDDVAKFVKEKKYSNSYFFIKGARFWRLENIVEYL